MVSQKDIARKLNMTQQAVSAALRAEGANGTVKVSPETRQLVLETARQMGYRSNRYASILKTGRSQTIAILHGRMTNDWIPKRLSLNASIVAAGYTPLIAEMPSNCGETVPSFLDDILSAKVEGVIVAGAWFNWHPEWFWKAGIPVVSLQGWQMENVPYIGPEKIDTYREILVHLHEQGCRRPMICLGAPPSKFRATSPLRPDFLDRPYREVHDLLGQVHQDLIRGFHRFVCETGFEPPSPFCVHFPEGFPVTEPRNEFEQGQWLAREALKHQPDALVYVNDSMAVGGLYECFQQGYEVPRDLCITGFNGEDPARFSLVPITTAHQPSRAMSDAAVRKLLEVIGNKTLQQASAHLFPCEFEPRSSSLRGASTLTQPLAPLPL